MAALTRNADYTIYGGEGSEQFPLRIVTDAEVFNGALLCFDSPTGAVEPYNGGLGRKLCGWHFGDSVVGDTSADDPKNAFVHTGPFEFWSLPVGGLAGTDADLGKDVYATNDGTYTITDPVTTGSKIGIVIRSRDATHCDVAAKNVFGYVET